ncbi:MAG TPA: protein YgfX, partial [Gammaproteobacteria bacterium]
TVERAFSPRLGLLFFILYSCAAVASVISDIPTIFKIILGLVILGSVLRVCRVFIFSRDPHSLMTLQYAEDQWTAHTRAGERRELQLQSAAFWLLGSILLIFRDASGKRHTMLLMPNCVSAKPLRELRGYIRHRMTAACI